MRICLVSREFPPFYGGGIGTYALQAARALTMAGHHVVVLTVTNDGERTSETMPVLPSQEDGARFTVERVPLVMGDDWSRPAPSIAGEVIDAAFAQLGPTAAFSIEVARALPAIVERHGIEIVEGPECGAPLWWTLHERRCGIAWRRGEAPMFVVHLHSPNAWIDGLNRHVARKRAAIELREMERESAQMADLVISPSHDLAAWCAQAWNLRGPAAGVGGEPRTGRVRVVPYPLGTIDAQLDAGVPGAKAPERQWSDARSLRVLFAGRLEPRKGVDLLMAACVAATRAGATVTLDIAGDDTWDGRRGTFFARRTLQTLVPPELRDRFTLHGKLTQERLAMLRARADLFAAPGAFDNFPYTVIEAMAAGMPIVAPRYGGASELVRDGVDGVLFEPHDTRTLADALVRVASMDAASRAAMGRCGAERARSFCANERAIAERERVFGQVRRDASVPSPSREESPLEVVVLGAATQRERESLSAALRAGDGPTPIGFAIGWASFAEGGRAVVARGALTPETLALAGPCVGPIALRRDVFERLVGDDWSGDEAKAPEAEEDRRALMCRLMEAGVAGIALPLVIGAACTSDSNSGDGASLAEAALACGSSGEHSVPGAAIRLCAAIAAWRDVPLPWSVVPVDSAVGS
jgi:glycosyltransferase involved in cell wall biosynthesis